MGAWCRPAEHLGLCSAGLPVYPGRRYSNSKEKERDCPGMPAGLVPDVGIEPTRTAALPLASVHVHFRHVARITPGAVLLARYLHGSCKNRKNCCGSTIFLLACYLIVDSKHGHGRLRCGSSGVAMVYRKFRHSYSTSRSSKVSSPLPRPLSGT